jgi:hypothetical protein
MFNVKVLAAKHSRTNLGIGIYMVPEGREDVDDAFDQADRDNFHTVFFFVSDLSLITYIRAAERFYVSNYGNANEAY